MAGSLELVRQGHRDQADLTSMLDTIDPDLVRLTREVVLCQRAALLRTQATAQAEFERALGVRAHVEDRFGRGLASAAEREAAEAALRRADAALDSASAELAAFDTISIPDRARQLVLRVAATDEASEDG